MRRKPRCLLLVLALCVGWPSLRAAEPIPDWEDPAAFGRGTLAAHATLTPWPDEGQALNSAPGRSKRRITSS